MSQNISRSVASEDATDYGTNSEPAHSFTEGTIREESEKVIHTTRAEASRLVSVLQKEGRRQFDRQQKTAASALRGAAEALRGSTPTEPRADVVFAHPVADVIDHAADSVEHVDPDAVLADIKRISREQPAAVAIGALAIGILASRFIKSSNR